ncbi:MAG: 3-dehydroquinate synthase [Bacteroidales bacterium]|nr:3-dehydroquinate synthase [Bacteroidales bacterium]
MKTLQSLDHLIYIGDESFDKLKELIKKYDGEQIVVIADENTRRDCLPLLPVEIAGKIIVVPVGEEHKNIFTATEVWKQLLEYKINRNGLIINLGGGVVGDLGGFCASTWKRGVDFIQIPTSLLAMVDASCGGKTGVNLDGIKNQIGTFNTPQAVVVAPCFLKTLPQREFLSGIAEMVKHAIISEDKSLFQQLSAIETPTVENIAPLIEPAIAIKNDIVLQDPHEKNLRKILNFGHTIGHAIETWSHSSPTPLLHGEAVALGMKYEIQLAQEKQLISITTATRYIAFIQKFFGHITTEPLPSQPLLNIMQHDKKNASDSISFVLPLENGTFALDVEGNEMFF